MTKKLEDRAREWMSETCSNGDFPRIDDCAACAESLTALLESVAAEAREETQRAIAKWLREEGAPQMAGYDQRLARTIEAGDYLPAGGAKTSEAEQAECSVCGTSVVNTMLTERGKCLDVNACDRARRERGTGRTPRGG